jgi:hypothetical protein
MELNIRSLVRHVIDTAVGRIVTRVEQEDSDLLTRLATKINFAHLGAHVASHLNVDYHDLSREMDYAEVAEAIDAEELAQYIELSDLAGEINTADLGEYLEINAETVADCIRVENVARYIDIPAVAESIDMGDLCDSVVDNFDYAELAQYLGINAKTVAEHLDYGEVAKRISPLDALAASQEGLPETPAVVEPDLTNLSGKLLDAAVNKLLTIANRVVEEDEADGQRDEQVKHEGNGQSGPAFVAQGVT